MAHSTQIKLLKWLDSIISSPWCVSFEELVGCDHVVNQFVVRFAIPQSMHLLPEAYSDCSVSGSFKGDNE